MRERISTNFQQLRAFDDLWELRQDNECLQIEPSISCKLHKMTQHYIYMIKALGYLLELSKQPTSWNLWKFLANYCNVKIILRHQCLHHLHFKKKNYKSLLKFINGLKAFATIATFSFSYNKIRILSIYLQYLHICLVGFCSKIF